ncbi:hypothetical protein GCM10010406_21200 [Streptomyces thermolineatus]|uniref:Uncharacterized protein n=1 Tax=Streptomyces thermolineatus TaxID=44033 RepID=A0ABP5YR63_9ACTN
MAGERSDVAAGVFVAGLLVLLVSLVKGWWLLVLLAAAVMVGTVVATARRRRTGPDPDVTLRPGGEGRPWKRK